MESYIILIGVAVLITGIFLFVNFSGNKETPTRQTHD